MDKTSPSDNNPRSKQKKKPKTGTIMEGDNNKTGELSQQPISGPPNTQPSQDTPLSKEMMVMESRLKESLKLMMEETMKKALKLIQESIDKLHAM